MEIQQGVYTVIDQDGKTYVIDSHLSGIDLLAKFMREVLETKAIPFRYQQKEPPRRRSGYIKASPLADHFASLHAYAALFTRSWVFAPECRHFFEVYRQHPIRDCSLGDPNLSLSDGRCLAELFNEFVHQLRTTAKDVDLKRAIRHWRRQTVNNRQSLRQFQAILFERYSRLLVIRLDFHYHRAQCDASEIQVITENCLSEHYGDQVEFHDGIVLPEPRPVVARVSLEEVLGDKDHLFGNRRGNRTLFEHLVGYVWCVEFTPAAGYHLHIALFFDGHHVQSDAWRAEGIGWYWVEVITEGRGYFYNCNRDRSAYGANRGLGMVDHRDQHKRRNLSRALAYLVKENQRVRVKPHRKCRTFGAVIVNRNRSPRTGRPRQRRVEPFKEGA